MSSFTLLNTLYQIDPNRSGYLIYGMYGNNFGNKLNMKVIKKFHVNTCSIYLTRNFSHNNIK